MSTTKTWKELAKQQENTLIYYSQKTGADVDEIKGKIPHSSESFPLYTDSIADQNGIQIFYLEDKPSKADISLLSKFLKSKLTDINLINAKLNNLELYNQENSIVEGPPKSFNDLKINDNILKAIYACGYHRPSRIQELTLPIMLEGNSIIAQSQSGTGKTAAFVIASLSKVDLSKATPQILCLAPTFELALQIYQVFVDLSKYMDGCRIGKCVKGCFNTPYSSRPTTDAFIESALAKSGQDNFANMGSWSNVGPTLNVNKPFNDDHLMQDNNISGNENASNTWPLSQCHIIVGTPGTVHNGLRSRKLPSRDIKVFILDEADVMLDLQGLADTSIRISRMLDSSCQKLFFSATYDENIMKFAKSILPNAMVFSLEPPKLVLSNIAQSCVICQDFPEKLHILLCVYGSLAIGQCIVFCDTKKQALYLSQYLTKEAGFPVSLLSSDLSIDDRSRVIQNFRDGKERLLIATNVLARGIDIEQVNLVLNFDLPTQQQNRKSADIETYLHRIGRCGRFGKKGLALNLIEPNQYDLIRQIEDNLKIKIPVLDKNVLLNADTNELENLLEQPEKTLKT